ncbi:MAG: hypothetical protein RLZZ628_1963 [Bacteroidota bacterium]|jgi:hypothetical protein
MEQIQGIQISNLGFQLTRQGDLLYHEGPLLSHFTNEENKDHYLYKWSDCDEIVHRWLIFKVSVAGLRLFFETKCTLLQLIHGNPFVYFVDLDTNQHQTNLILTSTDNIPKDYLPSEKSFFKPKQYEKYAFEFKEALFSAVAQEKEPANLELPLNQLNELIQKQNDLISKQNELITLFFKSYPSLRIG